jgi:predicted nucleotidyltransferase
VVQEPYKTVLEKLVEVAKREFGDDLVSIVLYGSVARGDNRPDSDVDLLLVVRNLPKDSMLKRIRLFEEKVEGKLGLEEYWSKGHYITLSPVLKTPEEAERLSPLYLDMVEDAVILFDKDNFFSNVLERLRKRLRELGAERVRMGKRWYWVLKKDYRFGEVIEL